MYTFVSPLASSMMAPGLREVALMYSITDTTTLAMTLSIYLLSFAIGVSPILILRGFVTPDIGFHKPLILAPVSEMYGRTWVRIYMLLSGALLTFL
jgi:hypothetical protein